MTIRAGRRRQTATAATVKGAAAVSANRLAVLGGIALALWACDDSSKSGHPCDSCLECEECSTEATGEPHCVPISHEYQQCVDNSIHWFDACGGQEEEVLECFENSRCEDVSSTEAECWCVNNWEGDLCDQCPANFDPDQDCLGCLPNWDGEDCDACSGNWDIEKQCLGCTGAFDPETDCEECLPGWTGAACDAQAECVRYVVVDAAAYGNGFSWTTALASVPSAAESAAQAMGDDPALERCEIWVAEGVHYVFESSEEDTIRLVPGVHLYGGFAGNEASLDERDYQSNKTYLDGSSEDDWEDRVYNVVVGEGDCVVDGVTIQNGRAEGTAGTALLGGGINCDACEGAQLRNSTISVNDGLYGGGLGVDGGDMAVSNCTFQGNNSSEQGGAVYLNGGEIDFTDVTFSVNEAGAEGGAIYAYNGVVNLDNATFTSNESNTDGGAVYLNGTALSVTGCAFNLNSADSGGGVASLNADVEISGSTFQENEATSSSGGGGALRTSACDLSLHDSQFVQNTATYGGAVHASEGLVEIASCEFISNEAILGASSGSTGGGLLINDVEAGSSVTGCQFTGNTAGEGGGMRISDCEDALVSSCAFTSNTGDSGTITTGGYGGGMDVHASTATVSNCLFTDNVAEESGAALFAWDATSEAAVINCTFWNNTGGAAVSIHDECAVSIANSIFQGGSSGYYPIGFDATVTFTAIDTHLYTGDGNLQADASFVDTATGDFRLQAGSPGIDAADGDLAPSTDLDGNPRVDDPATFDTGSGAVTYADMGAYEYQP